MSKVKPNATIDEAIDAGYTFQHLTGGLWPIQSPGESRPYTTSEHECDCYAGKECKHMRWVRKLNKGLMISTPTISETVYGH